MANFGALGTLRHAYRTLNRPSTSALIAGERPAISVGDRDSAYSITSSFRTDSYTPLVCMDKSLG